MNKERNKRFLTEKNGKRNKASFIYLFIYLFIFSNLAIGSDMNINNFYLIRKRNNSKVIIDEVRFLP